jgi:hypothetical protein
MDHRPLRVVFGNPGLPAKLRIQSSADEITQRRCWPKIERLEVRRKPWTDLYRHPKTHSVFDRTERT